MSSMAHKALALAAGIGGIVGIRSATEEPAYQVEDRIGAVEVRAYGERIAAETQVRGSIEQSRSVGFSRIAGYIFGANSGKASIAMTAPVAQTKDAGEGSRIQFFMPATWSRGRLPEPNDATVKIVSVPAQKYAVLRFNGSWSAAAVAAKEAELLGTLPATRWRPCGDPVAWFYDPPWTLPPLRRNEVAVCVKADR